MLRYTLYIAAIVVGIVIIGVGLFAFNGLVLAKRETPISGFTSHPPASSDKLLEGEQIRVMSYNIAKAFIYKGGYKGPMEFVSIDEASARLRRIADVIKAQKPDIVFLSEIVFECTPCPINQVKFLAEETGMHTWSFGENYNIGLPFYRAVGGNAILSRWPLELIANPSLAGRKPFYITGNNRRILWCSLNIGAQKILLGSVHNDSFSLPNNLRQVKQILEYIGKRPALLCGDFNAAPHDPSIEAIRDSGKFIMYDGPLTYPSDKPEERIDYTFAPKIWELLNHQAIETDASDHLPIVSTFLIKVEQLISQRRKL